MQYSNLSGPCKFVSVGSLEFYCNVKCGAIVAARITHLMVNKEKGLLNSPAVIMCVVNGLFSLFLISVLA